MSKNFDCRLSNLISKEFSLDLKTEKLCDYAYDEITTWLNKFISLKFLPKDSLNNLEILVKPNEINGLAENMFGRFQGEFRYGVYIRQIIVNVCYCIINYNSGWNKIYKTIEDFIGNTALHEVCHYAAFYAGVQKKLELMHGVTWINFYKKFRSTYTLVPLKISKDGRYTNFENKFNELWSNDYYYPDSYICNDYQITNLDEPRMGEVN